MRTVQLDKNAGGKKLRNACTEQGVVRCVMLPQDLRDTADDPEVVEFGAKNGYLTLTFDTGFFASASQRLARYHSGVLLLREDDNSLRQMSTKTAPKALADFKEAFPDWHSVPWDNSVVELTPTLIYVYRTRAVPPKSVIIQRDEPGWQMKLQEYLEENTRTFPRETS